MKAITQGCLVRPTHVGEDQMRRTIDYRKCSGRVVALWTNGGGEPVADVVWLRGHPYGKRTNGYPLAMLEPA